jgi:hypothetical protein
MQGRIDVWAPPSGVYGPWQRLPFAAGGPFRLSVSTESTSNVEGTYDGLLRYYDCDDRQVKTPVNPDATALLGSSVQQPAVRFRAHLQGQMILVTYRYVAVENALCGEDEAVRETLSRPFSAVSERDVRRVMRSDGYWTAGHPDHERMQAFAAGWYRAAGR